MIRWAIHRPAAAHAFGWAVLLLGGLAAARLPLATRTTVEFPRLQVAVAWPGASAELVESYLTAPLEAAVQGVRGVRRITSESSDGGADLTVELQPGTDTRLARLGVLERIEVLRPEFPAGVTQPVVSNAVPEDLQEQPLLQYTLSGPFTAGALTDLAERHAMPALASLPGVAAVRGFGMVARSLDVTYEPSLLNTDVTPADLALALQGASYRTSVGTDRRGATSRPVLLDGEMGTRAALESLPIRGRSGKVYRLQELASVRDDEDTQGSFYRIDGVPAVSLAITRLPGADAIRTAQGVRAAMQQVAATLPDGVRVAIAADEARALSHELAMLAWRSLAALALVFVVILAAFRDLRTALTVLWVTAVAVAGTALTLYVLRMPANLLTLAGLGMGAGILVQGAAIVAGHLRRGEGRPEVRAARAREAAPAVVGSTLTTAVVLLPFTWLQGNARAAFTPFAAAFAVALGWTLLSSLVLAPAVLPGNRPRQRGRRLRLAYQRGLLWLLRWRPAVLGATLALVGVVAWGFATRVHRGSYSSWYGQRTTLGVRVAFPRGSDPASLDVAMRAFEKIVVGRKGVERVVAQGMPDGAFMRVIVAPDAQFTSIPFALQDDLTSRAVLLGGAEVAVYGQGPGFSAGFGGGGMSFRIKVQGYSWDGVEQLALDLQHRLERIPRVRDVDVNAGGWWRRERSFDVVLVPDRGALAALDMSARDFAEQLAREVRGPQGGIPIRLDDGEVHLTLKARGARDRDLAQLGDAPLPNALRAPVRVRDVARVDERETLSQISRDDQQYVRIVSYDFRGPPRLATRTHEAFLRTVAPPPGYVIADQGFTWASDTSAHGLWLAFATGVALVILSVALVFNSWWAAGLVLVSLPLALAGVAATFWITGAAFSREAAVGAILVVGLAVNQVILLLDALLPLRRAGRLSSVASVRRAGARAGMIVLVTLTTLASLLPLAVGTAADTLFGAIALASLGGTLAATLVALFLMPLLAALTQSSTGYGPGD